MSTSDANAPANTTVRECRVAMIAAIRKVLSPYLSVTLQRSDVPISDTTIIRKAEASASVVSYRVVTLSARKLLSSTASATETGWDMVAESVWGRCVVDDVLSVESSNLRWVSRSPAPLSAPGAQDLCLHDYDAAPGAVRRGQVRAVKRGWGCAAGTTGPGFP